MRATRRSGDFPVPLAACVALHCPARFDCVCEMTRRMKTERRRGGTWSFWRNASRRDGCGEVERASSRWTASSTTSWTSICSCVGEEFRQPVRRRSTKIPHDQASLQHRLRGGAPFRRAGGVRKEGSEHQPGRRIFTTRIESFTHGQRVQASSCRKVPERRRPCADHRRLPGERMRAEQPHRARRRGLTTATVSIEYIVQQ